MKTKTCEYCKINPATFLPLQRRYQMKWSPKDQEYFFVCDLCNDVLTKQNKRELYEGTTTKRKKKYRVDYENQD